MIYDVSLDLENSFGMWNSLIMGYSCAYFHNDMTINDGIACILPGCQQIQRNSRQKKQQQILAFL